ncbi:TIGR02266 family protein [Myxococcus sp. 1LA]
MKLKHETVGSFAEEFATNLSPGGMFIRSRTPQAVGTPVKFEVQIAGGVRVLRGSALVRWVREVGDPSGPPGMGLQFEELDTASRALIEMMLMRKTVADSNGPSVQPLPSIAPSVAPSIAPAVAPAIAPSIAPAVSPIRPAPVPPVQARPAPRAAASRGRPRACRARRTWEAWRSTPCSMTWSRRVVPPRLPWTSRSTWRRPWWTSR